VKNKKVASQISHVNRDILTMQTDSVPHFFGSPCTEYCKEDYHCCRDCFNVVYTFRKKTKITRVCHQSRYDVGKLCVGYTVNLQWTSSVYNDSCVGVGNKARRSH